MIFNTTSYSTVIILYCSVIVATDQPRGRVEIGGFSFADILDPRFSLFFLFLEVRHPLESPETIAQ